MKKCLNLGCQIHHFDSFGDFEWINQDIVGDDKDVRAEIVCDAAALPLPADSVDFIYAGHLVEHFYPDTLPDALKEWWRVLKIGGKLVVVTPDSGAVMRDYAAGRFAIDSTWQQLYGRIYAYDRASERHHIAFDSAMLEKMVMADLPWRLMQPLDLNRPPEEIAPFVGPHIARAAYQLGMIFTK